MSLFKKALDGSEDKKKKAGSNKKQLIIKNTDLAKKAMELAELNRKMDALKAEAAGLDEEIRTEAKAAFIKEYESTEKYPGSVEILFQSGKGDNKAQMLFVPVDRYLSIDKDRATELKKIINDEIVSENIVWTLDPAMVEKHGEEISKLIEKSTKIPAEDKEKLISGDIKYSVRKGAINEAMEILPKAKEVKSLEDFLTEIRPIYQSKNLKALEEVK